MRLPLLAPCPAIGSIDCAVSPSAITTRPDGSVPATSVAATIQARRLERSRVLLLDPARRRWSIADLARAVGFARADHFSHAFRARFGVTARELRASRGATPSGGRPR